MSDIASIGLDISSFSPEKKNVLMEFLSLFDKIEKFDGKTFNPALGGGIVEFNQSLQQTSTLLTEIINKLNTVAAGMKNTNVGGSGVQQSAQAIDASTNAKTKNAAKTAEQIQKEKDHEQELQRVLAALYLQGKAYDDNEKAIKKYQAALEAAERQEKKDIARAVQAAEKNKSKQPTAADHKAAIDAAALREEAEVRRAAEAATKTQNKSKQEEAKINKVLLDEYGLLNAELKEQAIRYSNLHTNLGKNHPQTQQALKDYKATRNALEDIDIALGRTEAGLFGMGKGASTFYNQIRTLAYILPGIGIAGIFNVAFEAISAAADQLGIFNSESEKMLQLQTELTKNQKELLDILKEIDATYKTVLGSQQVAMNNLLYAEAGGKSTLTRMELERDLLRNKAYNAGKDLETNLRGGTLDDLRKEFVSADTDLQTLKKTLENKLKESGTNVDQLKKQIELAQMVYEMAKDNYEVSKALNEDVASTYAALAAQEIRLTEFKEEEKRKLILESNKLAVQNQKNSNALILEDDRNFLDARIKAIKSNYDAELKAINAQKQYILSRPDARNQDGTLTTDSKVAIATASELSVEALRKRNRDIEVTNIQFYQRYIKAITEISKAELEIEAEKNDRIVNDDTKTLAERLVAYHKYIELKQAQQRLERDMELQKGASKSGGKTSNTPEEEERIRAEADKMIANIQANAQKKVYDIVYQSLQKQFNLVKDENDKEITDNNRKHAIKLELLNEEYRTRRISHSRYLKERERLDREFRDKEMDDQIQDDNEDIARLLQLRREQMKVVSDAEDELVDAEAYNSFAPTKATELRVAEAQGKLKAAKEAVRETNNAIDKEQNQLDKDIDKKAQRLVENNKIAYKAIYDESKKLGNAIIDLWKAQADARFEILLEENRKRKELADEQNMRETEAIERSSLSAKDKTALDIQLRQQKLEADKAAAAEEKKIKHDQAVVDRELTLIRIAFNTAEGISAALLLPPPADVIVAAERAAIGAIQAAIVLSKPIPSFAEGVENFEGGYARTGEAGAEIIKEPYKSPYLVLRENISYLPKGTDVIPIKDNPNLEEMASKDGWEQVQWLAKQMKKNNKAIVNNINVKIDLGLENRKNSRIYGV